jgi:hypothetical protein
MNEIDFILLTDYLFFLIFILFLALVIGLGIKGFVWLIVNLGVIQI